MAEPAGSKSERTRQRIKDATARVLSQQGYGGTRLVAIAEAADVQMPNIYYYFTSRDELIEEVIREGVRGLHDQVVAALDAAADAGAHERMRTAVAAHLRSVLELSDYTTASTRNAGQLPSHIRQGQRVEEQRYARLWQQLVSDLRAAGGVSPELDDHTVRMFVLGALNWAPEWWRSNRGDLDALVEKAQRIVMKGIEP